MHLSILLYTLLFLENTLRIFSCRCNDVAISIISCRVLYAVFLCKGRTGVRLSSIVNYPLQTFILQPS